MNVRQDIYRLLYMALIEIRLEAHSINNKKIFYLADLLHNTPLKLERVLSGEDSDEEYKKILVQLREDARDKGIEKWIDNVINTD